MSDGIIRRVLNDDAQIELRAKGDGGPGTLRGYAAVFDSLSENLGGFREIIRPGAFAASLKENPDVAARIQHEGGLTTIGRTTNGTLRVEEDERGLLYEVDLPNTSAGRDIAELVRRGDIDKSSFAFTLRDDGETESQRWDTTQEPMLRELLNLNLHDVAPVDGPAYQATSVQARAHAKEEIMGASADIDREFLISVKGRNEKDLEWESACRRGEKPWKSKNIA